MRYAARGNPLSDWNPMIPTKACLPAPRTFATSWPLPCFTFPFFHFLLTLMLASTPLWAQSPVQTDPSSATPSPVEPQQATPAHKAASNVPGQFDFYVLELAWGPAFCSSIQDVGPNCQPQTGFVVHGLWPQNADSTWPEFCAQTPPQANLPSYLDITPDLQLLQHEWQKHGTCSGLTGAAYFEAAREASGRFHLPLLLRELSRPLTVTPLFAMNMFYGADPAFPDGSLALRCKDGRLTAVEACFTKTLGPVRCQGIQSCDAQILTLDPLPGTLSPVPLGLPSPSLFLP